MKKLKCVICKKQINGFGNNAEPVKKGLCCDLCNDVEVIPARLKSFKFPSDKKYGWGYKIDIKIYQENGEKTFVGGVDYDQFKKEISKRNYDDSFTMKNGDVVTISPCSAPNYEECCDANAKQKNK